MLAGASAGDPSLRNFSMAGRLSAGTSLVTYDFSRAIQYTP
jgi:hypothetical protein